VTAKAKKPALTIDVNIDELTVIDLEVIDKATRGEATLSDEIAIFERVVVGGVRHLRASDIRKIRDTILEALVRDANDPN
jgi:hypothetical protein